MGEEEHEVGPDPGGADEVSRTGEEQAEINREEDPPV